MELCSELRARTYASTLTAETMSTESTRNEPTSLTIRPRRGSLSLAGIRRPGMPHYLTACPIVFMSNWPAFVA